ncbi:MAG: hypothetical protein KDA21_07935 [Phycisphaerales bacterium]|nr:hypothetical protein [Phycisphaerales bacterium]
MAGSDEQHHDSQGDMHPGQPPSPLPTAALIRAAADDEVTPDEQARLRGEPSDARIEERVAFERGLRQAVRRQMAGPEAPADLRERIAAALAAAPLDDPDTITSLDGDTRRRSFWTSPVLATLGRWGAIAAVLAIAATLIVNASRSTSSSPYTPEEARQLVSFIGSQHDHCKDLGEYWERKMEYPSIDQAHAAASEILHLAPDAFHFEEPLQRQGYTFEGLGRCAVPGGEYSVHLLYKRVADGAMVSLFLQSNAATRLPPSCCLVNKSTKGAQCTIWQEGPVRYYVFSEDTSAVHEILEAFKVHRNERKLATP